MVYLFKNKKILKYSILFFHLFSFIITVIELSQIPWKYIDRINIFMFLINMIFGFFCFFVIIYYIYMNFNNHNHNYNYKYNCFKCYITFGFISNIISLLCIILMIIDSILIIIDLKNEKREVYSYDKKKLIMVKEIKNVITKNKLGIIVISLILSVVFWMFIFIFWCFIIFLTKREYKNYLIGIINKESSLESSYNYDNMTCPSSDFNQTEDIIKQKNIKIFIINDNNSVKIKKKSELEKRKSYTAQKKERDKKDDNLIYHSLKLDLKVLDFNDNNTYIDKSINSK